VKQPVGDRFVGVGTAVVRGAGLSETFDLGVNREIDVAADKKIEMTVSVIVDKRSAGTSAAIITSRLSGDIVESAVTVIAQ
jgi:hypothetical protein